MTRHLGWKFVDAKLQRRGYQFVVGQWTDPIDNPMPCKRGYHWCRSPRDLICEYAEYGPVVLAVESDGAGMDDGHKTCSGRIFVHRVASWGPTEQRLFAADCAERVRPIFESAYPSDARPRGAIIAARQFALGRIDAAAWAAASDAARAAASDAASDAARAAAWDAASDAARAAASDAAWAAAWAAASDAARAAAWDAASDAAVQWQTDRLTAYLRGALPRGAMERRAA